MSRAWSMGKTDRCKFKIPFHIFIGQVSAESKKNTFMQNVSPSSYDRHLKDKKDMPKWR
jgi:hypothetical protein